jgi:hypothetical protein
MSVALTQVIGELAAWSSWLPFADACCLAPRVPGVYLAREGEQGPPIYVGMAGERHGRGVQGRLAVYASGKALASGLGEAAFDRALADPFWLEQRLDEVQRSQPRRAVEWGQLAFERADLYVCWATTADKSSAAALERTVIAALAEHELWNRRR